MNIEQKPGVISEHPGYPHTIGDIIKATGIPNTRNRSNQLSRQIDRIALAPFTDPVTERVWLSEADFLLVVEKVKARKEKPTNLPNSNTKRASKSIRAQQVGETLIHTPKKEILLPNGERIEAEKNTVPIKIIRGAILAWQNKTHYLDSNIVALMGSPFQNPNEDRVDFEVRRANRTLGKYGSRLVAYETEVNGRKVRAFEIIEEKPKPTSFPEQKSPISSILLYNP